MTSTDRPPLRVLVVDDQQLLRRGLTLLLGTEDGIDVAAQAADGREALALLTTTEVDAVLTDAKMPHMDGIDLVRAVADRHPGLPVLVLTTFDEPDLVQGAIAAGAAGFLLKDSSTTTLADALRAAVGGGMVIAPRVARAAYSPPPSGEGEEGILTVLTPTERRVAEKVADGCSNQEIAAQLFLAEGTVRNHISALLRKTGARDRTVLALDLFKALR
ncbi:response regulator [Helcobacillus massiliensis]|uniref:DNA-binding NarL/FixJ family response regulator n=1 Tax=Helcobacillus massiliensis TaxID=521392 RepID=A0A839QXI0_9MICO|nr:response regulator transcription factor [Helcobacillus massiliensis]MBB3022681.1 DNA-binding NarL/FixJ family response regulator [Helcobacillus massiliensis]